MKRIAWVAATLILVSTPAFAGEILVNDTGETAYSLRVVFSEVVTITGFGDNLSAVEPTEPSTSFTFSGEGLGPWGSHWLNWEPAVAQLELHEWGLCADADCILPSLHGEYAAEFAANFERDLHVEWRGPQVFDEPPIPWRLLQKPWETPDENLVLTVAEDGIRIEGKSGNENRTGIQSVPIDVTAGFEIACLVRITKAPDSFELESWFGADLLATEADWATPYSREPHGVQSLIRVTWHDHVWNSYSWLPATGAWTQTGEAEETRVRGSADERILRLIYTPEDGMLKVLADDHALMVQTLSAGAVSPLEGVIRLSVSSDPGFPGLVDVEILGVSLGLASLATE